MGACVKSNILFTKNADSTTNAMLTKLLHIKIVPNRFLGFSNIFTNISEFFVCFFLISKISEGFSEKTATSEPDINADTISKSTNNITPAIKSAEVIFSTINLIPCSGKGSSLSKTNIFCLRLERQVVALFLVVGHVRHCYFAWRRISRFFIGGSSCGTR